MNSVRNEYISYNKITNMGISYPVICRQENLAVFLRASFVVFLKVHSLLLVFLTSIIYQNRE